MHRFFAHNLTEPTVSISGPEAHHLIHVLRLHSGDPIELLDGAGTIAQAIIESVARNHAVVRIVGRDTCSEAPNGRLTVAVSPPKGERLRWLVEKLTEIGVDRMVPLLTERSVVNPRDTKLDRLESTIIAACKQSGRRRLMEITAPLSIADVLQSRATSRLVIAHPGSPGTAFPPADDRDLVLLIGPEGGFTDQEVKTAVAAGAAFIGWPDTILRTETAALVFASQLIFTRGGRGLLL